MTVLLAFVSQSHAGDSECRQDLLRNPIQHGLWLEGELSGFDPCHSSVQWRVPKGSTLAPVVLAVHGGGGRKDAQLITDAFYQNGYATLVFDAYNLNGFERTPTLSNAARQAMLFKIAKQALLWLQLRTDIDSSRIHLYGISNGASVVLNLAALGPPYRVRSVFSEAPTPVGMGLTYELKAPTRIAFGKLDDLGAPVGKKRWEISQSCQTVMRIPDAPPGTSETCSQQHPQGQMPTTVEWAGKLKYSERGRLDIRYFDEVAHGAFIGPIAIRTWAEFIRSKGGRPDPSMEHIGWSEGGSESGRQTLLQDALRFYEQESSI